MCRSPNLNSSQTQRNTPFLHFACPSVVKEIRSSATGCYSQRCMGPLGAEFDFGATLQINPVTECVLLDVHIIHFTKFDK